MNWKTWTPLVLALGLGLLAAKVGRDLVARKGGPQQPVTALTKIVVARGDLAAGHALAEGDLTLAAVAADRLPRTAFRSTSEVAGRVLLAAAVKNQPLLESFLAPAGTAAGPQALVPAGMRAVTIDVNEERGVAGLLAPGCRVDVVSTIQDPVAQNAVTRTIVQNVGVMAVGQKLGTHRKDDEPMIAKSVTLIVTPQQAQTIDLASHSGRTRLVLRNPGDQGQSDTAGTTLAELLGTHRPAQLEILAALMAPRRASPAPGVPAASAGAAPKAQRWTVEVISGAAETTRVEFEMPQRVPAPPVLVNDPGMDPALPQ